MGAWLNQPGCAVTLVRMNIGLLVAASHLVGRRNDDTPRPGWPEGWAWPED
jgi:hypothetical protein